MRFIDRVIDESALDPSSFYRCDMCNLLTKGREGKLLNNGLFVCNWCRGREINFNDTLKEGETK